MTEAIWLEWQVNESERNPWLDVKPKNSSSSFEKTLTKSNTANKKYGDSILWIRFNFLNRYNLQGFLRLFVNQ